MYSKYGDQFIQAVKDVNMQNECNKYADKFNAEVQEYCDKINALNPPEKVFPKKVLRLAFCRRPLPSLF